MLVVGSALTGYAIEASDGRIGSVKNFLFDDTNWKIRWLVVDTGHWLSGRQVLVHPSAIGTPDHERQHLPVKLTKAQIEDSPDIQQDAPVTLQMQEDLYGHYDWDRTWEPTYSGLFPFPSFPPPTAYYGGSEARELDEMRLQASEGDPHLRSMTAMSGYHIHAADGSIGHLENFLIDDVAWTVHYLIVDTRNWWPGPHVLIAPYAVQSVDWDDKQIHLNVTRGQVQASPPWDPVKVVERAYQQPLHEHYGWPGYGW